MEIKKEDIKIGYGFCFGDKIYDIVASFEDNGKTLYVAKTFKRGVYSYSNIFYIDCKGELAMHI